MKDVDRRFTFINFSDSDIIKSKNSLLLYFLRKTLWKSDNFSDKYLLAQTYVYFIRCRLKPEEFTPRNFYYLLYLANDMEEDLDFKVTFEILIFLLSYSTFIKILIPKVTDHVTES